jgi:hypothetical protein
MPNIDNAPRKLAAALAAIALACLGLTACGGSSGSSDAAATSATTTSASAASTSTAGSSSQGAGAGSRPQRFSANRECLRKNGVTLPTQTPGTGGPAGGAGGGPVLPKGMTRAQFEATLRKCGGSNFGARFGRPGGPGGPGAAPRRFNNPVFRHGLATFATCLRHHGVNIPPPNTSNNAPIFSTKGINAKSPRFKAAAKACRSLIIKAFRSLQPANGAARAGGMPPTTGQTQAPPPVTGQTQGSKSSG